MGLGALVVLAAVVLALLPLHHEGVSGNAIRPRYREFGWFAYGPISEHATAGQHSSAATSAPTYAAGSRHAVTHRREVVGVLGGAGVVLVAGGLLARRRPTL